MSKKNKDKVCFIKPLLFLLTFSTSIVYANAQSATNSMSNEHQDIPNLKLFKQPLSERKADFKKRPTQAVQKTGLTIMRYSGIAIATGGVSLLTYMTFYAKKPYWGENNSSEPFSGLDKGLYIGGYVVGAIALGGGITMIMISSRKLKILKKSIIYVSPGGVSFIYNF